MYSQFHLGWHFRMLFQRRIKAHSSKLGVSFHWNVAKETFELWALSFRKCHPKWDWLYVTQKNTTTQDRWIIRISKNVLSNLHVQTPGMSAPKRMLLKHHVTTLDYTLSSVHGFIFIFQPNGSVVLDTTLSASVKVAAKQLPWQHYSGPVCVPRVQGFSLGRFRRHCLWYVRTPRQNHILVPWHWCCCVCTPQRKRQQKRTHTLQVTALEFSSVRKLRTFWIVCKLSACRERHGTMCLTGSLHAHTFPKMLRIPAPASSMAILCGRFICSVSPSVCARPTQSIMYVPLQVNRFQKSILLIIQYKYLKSCSGDFYSPESEPPHKIMRYWFYYSIQLVFAFPPDHAGQVGMFCTTVVPGSKGHLGGTRP